MIKISFLKGVRINIALQHNLKSFLKLKIKVKDKIVADGLNDNSFDVTKKGIHLDAQKFNDLLDDDDSICIDMRNHYESEIGHFIGAITPDVDTFRIILICPFAPSAKVTGAVAEVASTSVTGCVISIADDVEPSPVIV